MKKDFSREEKIDKGFELWYWNLSYRRKFIRTLWVAMLLILLAVFSRSDLNKTFKHIMIATWTTIFIPQLIYTYKKWSQEKIGRRQGIIMKKNISHII